MRLPSLSVERRKAVKESTKARAALIIGLWCAMAAAQGAAHEASTEQVRATLVAAADAVRAGDRIVLGVHQQIAPGWHTYWLNPGDTGKATQIQWQLPAGSVAGEIQWPTPQRFRIGPITNFGYADEVTLLAEVDVPASLQPGDRFAARASVNWLVCRESCIPQKVDLALSLPVVGAGDPSGTGSPLIAVARARLPAPSPWPVRLEYAKDGVTLRLANRELASSQTGDLSFFPARQGQISNQAEPTVRFEAGQVVLDLPPGDAPPSLQAPLSGVLVVHGSKGPSSARGYTVNMASPPLGGAFASTDPPVPALTLASMLGLALLGGLLLNLMPCVFPVLSIKTLSLLRHAQRPARENRLHGLAYTLGVLASFALLAGLLVALKVAGAQVGWGFQYQSPAFVLAFAYLMFALGLNLSGVFSFTPPATGWGSSLAARPGYGGSFFTGVLAAVVASPCTAPFMGAAVGHALTQPAATLLAVLLALGLGLALPYLLLANWPALQGRLPRPGRWMERARQALAFPMYAAAVWLVWVLARQAGVDAAAAALGGMVLIAFSAWAFETTRAQARAAARYGGSGLAAIAVAAAWLGGQASLADPAQPSATTAGAASHAGGWEPYSPQRLQSLRSQGEPVFLNLTAAWCVSCLVNERTALRDSAVQQAFVDAGAHLLKGDWTHEDPQITRKLQEFGRSGVPLYLYYPRGAAEPVVLPQILTPRIVLGALRTPA